jgi:hypothetical protein
MSKRENQLNDYMNERYTDIGIEDTKKRINSINEQIQHLDNERFYLISKLFNDQNKILNEDNDYEDK